MHFFHSNATCFNNLYKAIIKDFKGVFKVTVGIYVDR